MSSSIWNLTHPIRTGYVHLRPGGCEQFGTVIRQGKMRKTVSVLVTRYRYNKKYGLWQSRNHLKHVHDEDEYCRTGDKVVIKTCRKLSNIKHYFVRNVVLPVGRVNIYEKDITQYEREQVKYNEDLRAKLEKMII